MTQLISTTQKDGTVTTIQSQPVNSVFPIDQPSFGKLAYSSEWTWFTATSDGQNLYTAAGTNGGQLNPVSNVTTAAVGGEVTLTTGSASDGSASVSTHDVFRLGLGRARFRTDVNLSVLSDGTDEFEIACGLQGQGFGTVSNTDEALFRYTDSINSGNWVIASQSGGGGEEITNTAVAPVTGNMRQVLEIIVNDDATEIQFHIDGNLVATHTTVPTVALRHGMLTNKLAGTTSRSLRLLGAGWDYVFTTPV
jgi:hypothetical protein